VDPEILATGLGRCATEHETSDQNPPYGEGETAKRRRNRCRNTEGHEILHLVGLAGSLEYFTCDGCNGEDVRGKGRDTVR
jgi:hypothetical protein